MTLRSVLHSHGDLSRSVSQLHELLFLLKQRDEGFVSWSNGNDFSIDMPGIIDHCVLFLLALEHCSIYTN